MYYVPCLGPLVIMNDKTAAWAERVGTKPENQEFTDLEKAKSFARRIQSTVLDEKKKLLFDPNAPEESADS